MSDIRDHYNQSLNPAALLERIRQQYPHGATPEQLAATDQLHIGGLAASRQLLSCLPAEALQIVEIGSGLGGLQRLYSSQKNDAESRYIAIDITAGFNLLNRQLRQLCGYTGALIITADGQQLPLADNSADRIVLQHSLLNIPEPDKCLQECRRILKPGGSIILHEVLRGDPAIALQYPLPWASSADQSHLLSLTELQFILAGCPLKIMHQLDWSEQALQWRHQQTAKETRLGQHHDRLSPRLVFGERFAQMAENLLHNLQTGAVQVHELILEKSV